VAYRDYVRQARHEIEASGVDVGGLSDAELAHRLAGNDEAFRAATPAARAKAREIGFYARRAKEERRPPRRPRLAELQREWDRLKAEAEGARTEAAALRQEVTALRGELPKHLRAVERLTKRIEEERAFAGADRLELQDIARQITDGLLHAAPARTNTRRSRSAAAR
jgi:chromosome segregation ATPase